MNWKRLSGAVLCLITSVLLVIPAYAEAESIKVSLGVELQVTGDVPSTAEPATFELQPVDGAPMPDSSTITVTGAGAGSFSPITYTEPETYDYTLSQRAGNTEGCTYDETVYDVTVQVTTDDAGVLAAAVTVAKEGETAKTGSALFVNQYQVQGSTPSGPEHPSQNAPKTGDTARPALWIALGVAALLGLLAILWIPCRKRRGQS